MVAAVFFLSLMDVMVKHLSGTVPVFQIVWLRFIGQTVVLGILMLTLGKPLFTTQNTTLHIIRAISIVIGSLFFFLSFSRMALADATALMQLGPIMVALGAVVFLGEVLGLRRWVGIVCAFIGALIIIRPGSAVFSTDAFLPIIGTFAFTIYALITRFIRSDSPWIMIFLPGFIGAILTSAIMPFFWQPIPASAMLLVVGIICAGMLGNLFMIQAFTTAQASEVAPFTYAGLLFACIWGFGFFGEVPGLTTVLGAIVIVGSGLYVWHRDQVAQKGGA